MFTGGQPISMLKSRAYRITCHFDFLESPTRARVGGIPNSLLELRKAHLLLFFVFKCLFCIYFFPVRQSFGDPVWVFLSP